MCKIVNVLVFVLFLDISVCSYFRPCNETSNLKNEIIANVEIGPPVLYHEVEPALRLLEQPENKAIPAIQELLAYYYDVKNNFTQYEASNTTKRHPLIVLEGLSGSGKTTAGQILAEKVNGTQFHSPPLDLQKYHIRKQIRSNPILDLAYHAVAHQISNLEISKLLTSRPVIMDRYWYSSAAFGIAFGVHDYPEKYAFPPKGDKAYNWPKQMIKPDKVIFLDVDDNIRLQRIWGRKKENIGNDYSNATNQMRIDQLFSSVDGLGYLIVTCPRFRAHLIEAYENMQDPPVTVIDGNRDISTILNEIFINVQALFPDVKFN